MSEAPEQTGICPKCGGVTYLVTTVKDCSGGIIWSSYYHCDKCQGRR